MKRICCLLLLCCLLPLSALGETMRLLDVDGVYFRQQGISTEDVDYIWWDKDLIGLMESDRAPDLMSLNPDEMTQLAEKGCLADLGQSEVIRAHVARMVPWAQQAITDDQGRILAVPQIYFLDPFLWNADAFAAVGLTAEDAPDSFTALLDFVESWCDRLETEGAQPVCIARLTRWNTGTEKYNYCYWLMETLLECWEIQQTHAGQPVQFHQPQFVELAERARQAAQRLYQLEPRQKKRQNMPELFSNLIHGGQWTEYYDRDAFLSQSMPMRLTEDQPRIVKGSLQVWCVRADSPWQQEAIRYIDDRLNARDTGSPMLYMDHPAGEKKDYTLRQSWLDDYHAYDGTATYLDGVFYQGRTTETDKEAVLMKFFKGDISAETLAEKLDEIIR